MVKKKVTKKGLSGWVAKPVMRQPSTLNDTKNAVLVVSLLINLAFFVGWLALKLTNEFDDQVAAFLFNN